MGPSPPGKETSTYTHFLDKQFVGTVVKLDATGNRLIATAPQMSPYDPADTVKKATGDNIGTIYIVDYDPTNQSWSTNSFISSKFITGTPQQYLGNCATLSGDGSVFAIGSSQANNYTGILNIYNYNTLLAMNNVSAFSTNGKLTIAGGEGTNNIFAYSEDGGIKWSNSENDIQGGFFNGTSPYMYNHLNIRLEHAIECPNYTNKDTNNTFGGSINSFNNFAIDIQIPFNVTGDFFVSHYIYNNSNLILDSICLNNNSTIMAIGSSKYNRVDSVADPNSYGLIYMYSRNLFTNNWTLIQTITNPDNYKLSRGGNLQKFYSFGYAVKMNSTGSVMITSSPSWTITTDTANTGALYIFIANADFTQWNNIQVIQNPAYKGVYESYAFYNSFGQYKVYNEFLTGNTFGISIDINDSGSVIVVGALQSRYNQGVVYTLESNTSINRWNINQVINGPSNNTNDYFGQALSIDSTGTTMAVGSANNRVYIYNSINAQWSLSKTISTLGPVYSVSLNNIKTVLAFGGVLNTNGGKGGYVSIYDISGVISSASTDPPKLQELTDITNLIGNKNAFGLKVSLSELGNILVVSNTSSLISTKPVQSDSFKVYSTTDNWVNIFNTQTVEGPANTNFGSCLVIDNIGTLIVCSAPGNNLGVVYTYTFNDNLKSINRRKCNTIASNMTIWVAGGGDINAYDFVLNPFSYSYDGKNWIATQNTSNTLYNFLTCNVIKWNGGKFVAGGIGVNPFAYSYDGINWYSSSFTSMNAVYDLTWNSTYWIAVGSSLTIGCIAKSSDGISWTLVPTNIPFNLTTIASRGVITVNGNSGGGGGGNNQVSLATLNQSLGYNQTWKDLTPYRAPGVLYKNETGKPIVVNIHFNNPAPVDSQNQNGIGASGSNINIFVGGTLCGVYGYIDTTATFIVPPSTTYVMQGYFISWFEFS